MWSPGMTIAAMEREALFSAMKFYKENKKAVASALGISLKTVYNKLRDYGYQLKEDDVYVDEQEVRKKEVQRDVRLPSGGKSVRADSRGEE